MNAERRPWIPKINKSGWGQAMAWRARGRQETGQQYGILFCFILILFI